jgi:hypothetical protein
MELGGVQEQEGDKVSREEVRFAAESSDWATDWESKLKGDS